MTQEEKAKAYDEAIERAEKALEVLGTDKCEGARQIFSLFPELKESEDEKIRKALINFFDGWGDKIWDSGIKYSEVVAWLQKQGEHANFRNKIQIGDKVTRNDDGELVNLSQLKRVAKQSEPVVRENKGNDVGISPNSKWSEEDDENIMMIENRFSDYLDYIKEDSSLTKHRKNTLKEDVIGYFNWLKSLKGRYTWKPSDEQMAALSDINITGNISYAGQGQELINLYNDLKRLLKE